jgi:hypothetical protein
MLAPRRLRSLPRSIAALTVAFAISAAAVNAQGSTAVWGTVPSPNRSNLNNTLYAAASVAASDLWAVGAYNPGVPPTVTGRRTLAQHWNGQSWSIVATPNSSFSGVSASYLRGVAALASNDVWAVGYGENFASLESQTLTLHWNGARWSTVPSPNPAGASNPNQLFAISGLASNDVWAVGLTGFPEGALTLHWNGTAWQTVANGCGSTLDGVVEISPRDAWAVGGGASCHYDGTSWTNVPIASANGLDVLLFGVSASASSDVWAVGAEVYAVGESYAYAPIVEHWNGSGWTVLNPGITGESANLAGRLDGVEALGPNNVWAVGTDGTYPVVTHWNGTTWTEVPSPRPGGGALDAVTAVSAGDLWAVGSRFGAAGGASEYSLVEQAPSATQGTVVGATGVSGATVSWFGPVSGSTTTDLSGGYAVAGLPAGTYTLTATYGGCAPAAGSVTIVAGTTLRQNLRISCGAG